MIAVRCISGDEICDVAMDEKFTLIRAEDGRHMHAAVTA